MSQTFGVYGGRYVPETLIPALDELEAGWREAREDDSFHRELGLLMWENCGMERTAASLTAVVRSPSTWAER